MPVWLRVVLVLLVVQVWALLFLGLALLVGLLPLSEQLDARWFLAVIFVLVVLQIAYREWKGHRGRHGNPRDEGSDGDDH